MLMHLEDMLKQPKDMLQASFLKHPEDMLKQLAWMTCQSKSEDTLEHPEGHAEAT
jgi:hypothetical protein